MERISVLSLLLFVNVIFSQSQLNLTKITGTYNNGEFSEFSENNEMNGTPFLFDSWNNPSIITLTTGKIYKLSNINYDLNRKKFVSKISDKELFVFENINEVIVKGKKYLKINDVFYQEIFYNPKGLSLLKKILLKKVKPVVNKMTYQVIKKGEYKKKGKYFLKKGNELIEVKLKKSSILNELPRELRKELDKFSKRESLSFKDEGDLFKIMRYYNSL
ncbi:hypothetical protein [Tenacibaculum sp. 47A_GOM-205m]|uniref:hypothetical protein n=1 Tax=Tenacibaculum sp. 47A_GOM-205m TaxID=1380384 RepID=UPI00049197C2|nr:hypothetical protein [Tenacibaculum sp. 47A_GOM-205m]